MTFLLIPARAEDTLFILNILTNSRSHPALSGGNVAGCEADKSHLTSKVRLQGMNRDIFVLLRHTSSTPGRSSPATLCLDVLRNRQGGEVAALARG